MGYIRDNDHRRMIGGTPVGITRNIAAIVDSVSRAIAGVALCVVVAASFATAAIAEPLSGPERSNLEAQKAQLFQQMLSNPANLDVTFAYAKVAAQLGDNEAAVAALERMLLFNPDLA